MGSIELKSVRKDFAGFSVINGVDLHVEDGEFTVFVGPSGCGKSTLLRLIAGLEDISSGQILIDGIDATNIGPAQRGLDLSGSSAQFCCLALPSGFSSATTNSCFGWMKQNDWLYIALRAQFNEQCRRPWLPWNRS